MPWKERSVLDERIRFVIRHKDGECLAALCREFGEKAIPSLKKSILLGNRCCAESWVTMEQMHRVQLFSFVLDVLEHKHKEKKIRCVPIEIYAWR